MPDERPTDKIDKLLLDEKAIEERRRALIAELLKQKEAAIKEFDDKLAKLGYRAVRPAASRRSHHRKPPSADVSAKGEPTKA